jgi:hypothetical protein
MRLRVLTTAAWTSVAVLVGHVAAYRITYTDPHARAHALASSGHGWTGILPVLLVAAALGAAVGTISKTLGGRGVQTAGRTRTRETGILAIGGVLAYTAVELGERLLHHGNLDGVLHDLSGGGYTTLLVGVLFIVATAPLLVIVRRRVEAFITRLRALATTATMQPRPVERRVNARVLYDTAPTRGPPTLLLG